MKLSKNLAKIADKHDKTVPFSLEDAAKAIKTLEDRKVLGKVVVSME